MHLKCTSQRLNTKPTPQGPIYRFPKPLPKQEPLRFKSPLFFFQRLVLTIFRKRSVVEQLTKRSPKTSHTSFGYQMHNLRLTKASSTSNSLCHFNLGFPTPILGCRNLDKMYIEPSSQTSLIYCEILNSVIYFQSFSEHHHW